MPQRDAVLADDAADDAGATGNRFQVLGYEQVCTDSVA